MTPIDVKSLKKGDTCFFFLGRNGGFIPTLYFAEFKEYVSNESHPIKVENVFKMVNSKIMFKSSLGLNSKAECFLLKREEFLVNVISEKI